MRVTQLGGDVEPGMNMQNIRDVGGVGDACYFCSLLEHATTETDEPAARSRCRQA